MRGIVGYIGNKNAAGILLNGRDDESYNNWLVFAQ